MPMSSRRPSDPRGFVKRSWYSAAADAATLSTGRIAPQDAAKL
jgi:hypothetical protein